MWNVMCVCVCVWCDSIPCQRRPVKGFHSFLSLSLTWLGPCEVSQLLIWGLLSYPRKVSVPPSHSPGQRLGFILAWRGCQPHSARWCHAYAHRGRAEDGRGGGRRAILLSLNPLSIGMNSLFQKWQPTVRHNWWRLSQFYATVQNEKIRSLTLFLPVSLSLWQLLQPFGPSWTKHTHSSPQQLNKWIKLECNIDKIHLKEKDEYLSPQNISNLTICTIYMSVLDSSYADVYAVSWSSISCSDCYIYRKLHVMLLL